jgi:hypothetical protein
MKQYQIILYIRTKAQEFKVGAYLLLAKNADEVNDKLRKMEIPFHHYSTIQKVKEV